jgi:hypothetical protein
MARLGCAFNPNVRDGRRRREAADIYLSPRDRSSFDLLLVDSGILLIRAVPGSSKKLSIAIPAPNGADPSV